MILTQWLGKWRKEEKEGGRRERIMNPSIWMSSCGLCSTFIQAKQTSLSWLRCFSLYVPSLTPSVILLTKSYWLFLHSVSLVHHSLSIPSAVPEVQILITSHLLCCSRPQTAFFPVPPLLSPPHSGQTEMVHPALWPRRPTSGNLLSADQRKAEDFYSGVFITVLYSNSAKLKSVSTSVKK